MLSSDSKFIKTRQISFISLVQIFMLVFFFNTLLFPCASGKIRTLSPSIMSCVFYHFATGAIFRPEFTIVSNK